MDDLTTAAPAAPGTPGMPTARFSIAIEEASPVADNKTPAGRAADRRVEFVILDEACRVAQVGKPSVCK